MENTIREVIVHDMCNAIIGNTIFQGVIDDEAEDATQYSTPPQPSRWRLDTSSPTGGKRVPRPEWGKPKHPFCFVADISEEPNINSDKSWHLRMTVQVQCIYSAVEGGMAPLGRHYLGELKQTLMADRNRSGHARGTMYGQNGFDRVAGTQLARAWCDFTVEYFHNLADPTSRKIANTPNN